jgi:hypothetical protein
MMLVRSKRWLSPISSFALNYLTKILMAFQEEAGKRSGSANLVGSLAFSLGMGSRGLFEGLTP